MGALSTHKSPEAFTGLIVVKDEAVKTRMQTKAITEHLFILHS
jgi:hypothetical protein